HWLSCGLSRLRCHDAGARWDETSMLLRSLDAEDAAEVGAGDDGDAAEGSQGAEVAVVGNDEVGFAGDGAFEDAAIVWVGGDLKGHGGLDELRSAGDSA